MIPADGTNPYTRQDLGDLHDRWLAAVDVLCANTWSEENARKVHVAFEAIKDYIQAGSVPVDDGLGRSPVQVREKGSP